MVARARAAGSPGALLDGLALALLALSLATLSLHRIVAHDLWWQLAAGAWILEHGLPDSDPFSYAFPNRPWVELRWLYYLGLHALARSFGLNGLIVAKCLLLIFTFGVLAAALWARQRWVTGLGLLIPLCLMVQRFQIRPELMSFLWIALVLLCLERYKQGGGGRWLVALPCFQLLWSNTHTLWILGPALVWSLFACEGLQGRLRRRFRLWGGDPRPIAGARLSRLALAGLAVTAAGLASPYFPETALYPLTLLRQIRYGGPTSLIIQELRSPFLDAGLDFFFLSYLAAIYLSAASFWLRVDGLVLTRLVWWGGFLLASLLSARNVALFGLAAGFVTAANLRDWLDEPAPPDRLRRWLPRAARATLLLAGALLPALAVTDAFWRWQHSDQSFGFGVALRRFPIRAMAFVREHDLPTPVLGTMADSGYLLYAGGEKSVFIDGRLEVYGEEILEYATRVTQDGAAFPGLLEQYGIRTAILNIALQQRPIEALEAHPDWVAVYYDDSHVVYAKREGEGRARVDALAIDWSHPLQPAVQLPPFDAPADWLAGVFPRVPDASGLRQRGQLLLSMRSLDAARADFEAAARLRPDEEDNHLLLGIVQHALGEPEAAAASLSRVRAKRLAEPNVRALRRFLAEVAGR